MKKNSNFLLNEFDAAVWAKEFKRLFPDNDEGTMISWFACAIMTGHDIGLRRRDENPSYCSVAASEGDGDK